MTIWHNPTDGTVRIRLFERGVPFVQLIEAGEAVELDNKFDSSVSKLAPQLRVGPPKASKPAEAPAPEPTPEEAPAPPPEPSKPRRRRRKRRGTSD